MSFLKDALAYASMGLAVFPLTPGSKRPIAGSNGLKDATTDPARIGLWWGTQHPDANIGIVTGAISGITVLDVDSKKDVHGDMTLAALVAEHGSLPLTPKQATPSGGTHYVFAYAPGVRNSAGKLGKGLDIRGDGGYIAVAPSVVSEDRRTGTYTWERAPFDQALAPMPAWLLERVESAGATKPKSIRDMADAGRNVALTSLAGTMRRVGFQAHDSRIFEMLTGRGGVLVAIRSEPRAADALALLHSYGGGNAAIGAWTGRV